MQCHVHTQVGPAEKSRAETELHNATVSSRSADARTSSAIWFRLNSGLCTAECQRNPSHAGVDVRATNQRDMKWASSTVAQRQVRSGVMHIM